MKDTHREKERERQRHRQREKQASCREPNVGLNPGTPGTGPGQRADAQPLSHPGIPSYCLIIKFYKNLDPIWILRILAALVHICTFQTIIHFSLRPQGNRF